MTSCNFRHCQVKPLPTLSRSRESSLTIYSSVGPPSLAYSQSSGSSDSMRSAPPTPSPVTPCHFEAEAYARRVEGRYRPNENGAMYGLACHETTTESKVHSVYEPQARKPGHRVFVLERDRDKQSNTPNKLLVRCPPTRTGSNPIQESLPVKPDVVLSCWKTSLKFSFEPHRLSKASKRTSRDRKNTWFSPDPGNDPRDPIVEQTNQRTLQRLRPNKRPIHGLSSPPSWTPKLIISPLAMVLDHLERL
ncbi:hypothetical protein C8J55DRAFT_489904 [Lentinula edodes]|uniref:Uncharacterized protein n=1 Tax=Lentinula lateritia TaxID=40482 RepID=A0A9W9A8A7_9AGAR|nr:hypothetical protein C8J55DRAFT_489904 [Lentinula edodes]